jgi:hypothetical protein
MTSAQDRAAGSGTGRHAAGGFEAELLRRPAELHIPVQRARLGLDSPGPWDVGLGAGACVLLGRTWARALGIVLAVFSGLSYFVFLPYYPLGRSC